jgi:hypothetical protein
MAVVAVHTGIPTSPKHSPLSDGAFRLWMHALCWSKEHLTDGYIPIGTLPTLHPKALRLVSELLTTFVPGKGPLWHEVEGGYRVHDYEQWQDTKVDVQHRREQWRERQGRRRHATVTHGVTHGVTPSVTRESRVSHATGIGKGNGKGKGEDDRGRFDRFWDAYPRHTGKANALKAWAKLEADDALLDVILASLSWQREQPAWTKDAGAFVPHPATWLNGRRWEDERPGGPLAGLIDDESAAPLPAWTPPAGTARNGKPLSAALGPRPEPRAGGAS